MPTAPSFAEFDYVLEEDRGLPEDEQTVFRLRPLTWAQKQDVEKTDLIHTDAGTAVKADTLGKARRTLTHGLVGWRNFRDAEKREVPFKAIEDGDRRTLPESTLNPILPWAVELANAVTRRSEMSEAAAKNSGSPQR